jgi:Trk K+ transport system NAD-binding subunit
MIISLLKGPEDEGLIHKLEAFGFGFFIPVFFILVGVDLDLRALADSPDSLLFLPILIGIALVVKVVPMFISKRHFSWREMIGGGLLLNTHLSLEVAVAVIGLRTGLFDAATSTTVILFAIITVIVMPLLFGVVVPFVQKKIERFILIIGANELGTLVADQLRAHGDEVMFMDADQDHLRTIKKNGYPLIGNGDVTENLPKIEPAQLKSVLVLEDDDEYNLDVSRQLCSLGIPNVVAVVKDPELLPEFRKAGVKPYSPATQRGTIISMMARNPDALDILTSTTDERDTAEIRLTNPTLRGRRLRDLQLPGDMLVLSIRREGELMIPRGNTILEIGDRLTILGDLNIMPDIEEWLEGYSYNLNIGQPSKF